MVTDYELAWTRLGEYVSTKTQHGREGLLVEMQRIASESRVPAGELSRLLRLYGVEVERARSITAETGRDELDAFGGGRGFSPDVGLPDHHPTEEVDDGRRTNNGAGR